MLRESSSRGSALRDDDPHADCPGPPAALARDPRREAAISIRLPDKGADVHQLGLDLDDQDGGRGTMPGQQIDRAPLSVDREGDLGLGDPRRSEYEASDEHLLHRGVARIEEAVQLAAGKPHMKRATGIDRREQPAERRQPDRARTAAFDARHDSCRRARDARKLPLRDAGPQSEQSKSAADRVVVHGGRIVNVDWRRLIRRGRSSLEP